MRIILSALNSKSQVPLTLEMLQSHWNGAIRDTTTQWIYKSTSVKVYIILKTVLLYFKISTRFNTN